MPLLPYNIIPFRNERMYLTTDSTFGTYVVPANNNACRLTNLTLTPYYPMYNRRDKTGSLSQTVGIKGRIYGTYDVSMDLTGNGVAGQLPDAAILISGAFGQAATPTPAMSPTSQVWTLSDNAYTFDLWSYRNINGTATTNLEQRVAGSCVVTELTFNFGQDLSTLSARGDCLTVLDSVYFSSASAVEKGGLSTFAYNSEPSAPVTNGYPSQGFVGTISLDSNVIAEIKTGTISIRTGRQLVRDTFGSFVPTNVEAGERVVTMSFDFDDSDSSNLALLKTVSKTKVPIPFSVQLGNASGNEFLFTGSNLVLDPSTIGARGVRFSCPFPSSRAYSSSYTAKDEVTLTAQ